MAGDRIRSRSSTLARFARDQRGITAVLVALTLVALIGFTGLGVDAGWWYTIKRQNQSAADAAALSAAYEIIAGNTDVTNKLTPAATQAATQNRWVNTGTDPAITYPCPAATCPVGTGGVEVILHQQQNSWFASLFSLANVDIANRAVAKVSTLPPGCMLALNPHANDTINLAGNPTINAPDCTLVSDSDSASAFHLQGNSTINAAAVVTPGDWSHTGAAYTLTLKNPAQTGANFVPDPYASTLTHTFLTTGPPAMPTTGTCTKTGTTWSGNCVIAGISIGTGQTLSANTQISGGLSIRNGTVNLSPGTYWITDGDLVLANSKGVLQCSTCVNGGAGVTIILTTAKPTGRIVGTLTLDSQANLNLNAPKTGTFAGMVLIQDSNGLPAGTTMHTTSNAQANGTETLSGLVYFPDTAVTFQGTPATTGPQCLVLVANTIALQGTPGFATSGCANIGLNNLPIVKNVALAE